MDQMTKDLVVTWICLLLNGQTNVSKQFNLFFSDVVICFFAPFLNVDEYRSQ